MTANLTFVVPDELDDPRRPSGGNVYDHRLIAGLRDFGWEVQVVPVSAWTGPRGLTMVDGLVLSPRMVPGHGTVALVHLPRAVEDPAAAPTEGVVLAGCAGVIVPSDWARAWLWDAYGVAASVAAPGTDPAPVARGGGGIVSVGAVTPIKGHDILVAALAGLDDPPPCSIVGSLVLDPVHAERIHAAAADLPVHLTGPLSGDALANVYDGADLVVQPSRVESFGMVVTEALSRGIPVIATDVGGVREALGDGAGILVPPDDPAALAEALSAWQRDPALRSRLRDGAARRRTELRDWEATVSDVERALNRIATTSV